MYVCACIRFSWNTAILTLLHFIYSYFCLTMAKLNGCDRLPGSWGLKYDMTLYRELANPCSKYSLSSHHLPVPEAVLITTLHGKKALRVRASSLERLHEAHTQTLRFQDGPKIILVRTEVSQACVRNTGLDLLE